MRDYAGSRSGAVAAASAVVRSAGGRTVGPRGSEASAAGQGDSVRDRLYVGNLKGDGLRLRQPVGGGEMVMVVLE